MKLYVANSSPEKLENELSDHFGDETVWTMSWGANLAVMGSWCEKHGLVSADEHGNRCNPALERFFQARFTNGEKELRYLRRSDGSQHIRIVSRKTFTNAQVLDIDAETANPQLIWGLAARRLTEPEGTMLADARIGHLFVPISIPDHHHAVIQQKTFLAADYGFDGNTQIVETLFEGFGVIEGRQG